MLPPGQVPPSPSSAALPADHLVDRELVPAITERMAEEPVILLQGPRSVGKSTLLRTLATKFGTSEVDLDDPSTRDAVAADPGLFVRGPSPVLIDEFQHVPALLDSIKSELNRDLRPGRFILTGSTRHDSLPLTAQSLTGRLHIMKVWPLSQGEIRGRRETMLDRLLADPAALVTSHVSSSSRQDYITLLLTGGFPLVLRRASWLSRSRWYRDYLDLVLRRDVPQLRHLRHQDLLPHLLRHLVAQTAQPLNLSAAAQRAGLSPDLAHDYTQLLEAVFLIHRLPAWGTTLGSRIGRSPKLHPFDTGFAGWLLGLNQAKLGAANAAAMTELGHLLESFVVNELMKQASWSPYLLDFGHRD
jgi:predicted AAA+ superfamily ATPase